MRMSRGLGLILLALCPMLALSDTVTSTSNSLMLDTRKGDLTIDLNAPVAGELDLRLSTMWDGVSTGSLCVNGAKPKTLESASETTYVLSTSDYRDWYYCEWTCGSRVYTRTLRVNYQSKPAPSVEPEVTKTAESNSLMLDTRKGDLTIDLNAPVAGELDLRLSTVWDGASAGSLCINGAKPKTLGSVAEATYALSTSDYRDWYYCEWTCGSRVYTRTLRVNYPSKPAPPVEPTITKEVWSDGIPLDTRKGDLILDLDEVGGTDVTLRLSTMWDGASAGSLCVNGVKSKTLGSSSECDFNIAIAKGKEQFYFCEWTTGSKVYTRILRSQYLPTTCTSGSVRLDTTQGVRNIADYWGTLTYDASWYDDVSSVKVQECSEVIAEGAKGVVAYERNMCGYSFSLVSTDGNGQPHIREQARFAGGDADHVGVITKPAVDPTSSTAGSMAEITCIHCGKIVQAATVIPPLGYVRNVTARQLWPYRKIEICYELADDIGDKASQDSAIKVTCVANSSTRTATKLLGDVLCQPGLHRIVWNMDLDGFSFSSASAVFSVKYGSVSGSASPLSIDVSTSVCDGMNVGSSVQLGHSPIDGEKATLEVDGNVFLVSTNSGSFVWQPRTKGTHTLRHVVDAGRYIWVRTVNVTELVHELPEANPPTTADPNITIGTTSRSLATAARASGSITTSGTGTWTATVSDDWITIPAALSSRKAGLPVAYTVAANTDVEERTGYIYVSGHVYTISQAGVGAELDSYSVDVETDGGRQTVTVLADAQTAWHARSNVDWISVDPTSGVGEAPVTFAVAPWNEVSTRSGTITAAGCTFTVNQTGRRMKLNEREIEKDYLAHDIVLTVDALSSTDWGVAVDAPWLSIVESGTGHGGSTLTLAINENPSYLPRTASAFVGTETLYIRQLGRPTAALSFAISPETTTASVDGANGLVAVTATPDLPWTATSQANWLTVMPGFAKGAGNGNVIYSASPNPTMTARTGVINVAPVAKSGLAGTTHTVSQPAATATISSAVHTFAAAGGSVDVTVTTEDIVQWTVAENVGWLSVIGDMSRVGPGTVTLTAEANTSIDSREATLTVAGHPFTVRQEGQTVEVEYTSRVFDAVDFGDASIDVHPNGTANWTAVPSDPTWIVIYGGENCEINADGSASGTEDATIYYMVVPYVGDGEMLTGWITIGDKKVYVTQRAYEFSIDPCAADVSGNAGEGEISVPATVGQIWNVIATEPWITVIEGAEGEGPGTVRYTFTENDTGVTRTGKIIIAGEEYEVRQAARLRAEIQVRVEGEGTVSVGGEVKVDGQGQQWSGTFDKGESVTLTATAAEGWRFVGWSGVSKEDPWTFTADADISLLAVFERIPVYSVNGEAVREGTVKNFAAPEPVVLGGTTQLVCRGTSAYPEKGASFSLTISGDVAFEWDLWTANYWVDVAQSAGGTVSGAAGVRALPCWVEAGGEVTFEATPSAGYSLMRWRVVDATSSSLQNKEGASSLRSDGDVASPLVLRASAPLTVSAVFAVFNDTLATAADAPALTFRTGGDAVWTPVIDPTAETGYTSVRSGVVGAESETWLETTVSGIGTLSFNWRVDCERDDSGAAEWDRLTVFTNGVEAARIDGRTGWQCVTLPLTSPKTTVRWSFYRDDHDEPAAECENAAWIDGVEVVPIVK